MKKIDLKTQAYGELFLENDRIEINDKSSRMNKYLFVIFPFLFLITGIYSIISGILAEREIQIILRLLSGVLLLIIPVLFYHSNFKRTNKKELKIAEIENVRLKKIIGELFIDFELTNKATRRIYNIRDLNDWYIIKSHLTERNISCSD